MPTYNLPTFDHFRMLNPIMNCFIANRAAVFFSLLEGCSSNNFTYPDLFGDQQICVLLKPYGKGKTTGFWMLAVHPKDRHLIEFALERIQPEFRSELNWLFSWETETGKRFYHSNLQLGLPSLDDNPPFQGSFNEEAYRWPLPGDVPPID
ncbi:MAG: hypothetical protein H7308_05555 [Chthonomonadaceae bacterium]|nr:hypothetical protein [Chthonomonadaceae bacterium]